MRSMPPTAYGADRSSKMDFDEYDKIDDFELNEILWRAVKGKDAPVPPAVRRRSPIGRNEPLTRWILLSGFLECTLSRLEQPREPVHDVDRHLAVIKARHVHPKFLVRAENLGRELGGLTHHDHPAPAEAESHALSTTRGGDRLLVFYRKINRGIRQLEDRHASLRALDRRASEGLDAIDPLGIVAAPGDRVVTQKLILPGE